MAFRFSTSVWNGRQLEIAKARVAHDHGDHSFALVRSYRLQYKLVPGLWGRANVQTLCGQSGRIGQSTNSMERKEQSRWERLLTLPLLKNGPNSRVATLFRNIDAPNSGKATGGGRASKTKRATNQSGGGNQLISIRVPRGAWSKRRFPF